MSVGYLELPVSVQWGPDLLLFRPFVDVTPFIGYAVNSKVGVEDYIHTDWDGYMNKLSYGLGLGGGIEVWRLQFTCRYNWNFGPLFNTDGKMMIYADSDSLITKGLIALFIRLLSGLTPQEIKSAELKRLDECGLKEHLASTRANALTSMASTIRKAADAAAKTFLL